MEKIFFRILLVLFIGGHSQANASSTISEAAYEIILSSPMDLVPSASSSRTSKINLLKWNENPQDPPKPDERYDRDFHFGEWITLKQGADDCVDVRNRVLMRESEVPVQMRRTNPCKVGTGKWYDPYTDTTYSNSTEIQIDHYVP